MADPIIIYTDGAASGNPGPGGFGVVLKAGVYRKELMAGFVETLSGYIPATSGEVRLGKRTCRYPRKRTL